ncbi:MAG: hypothetical protein HGA85_08595 [Nanoarchaeota archaeon]|nr:hypothetical protein [Nanoarchaeota archaeon]
MAKLVDNARLLRTRDTDFSGFCDMQELSNPGYRSKPIHHILEDYRKYGMPTTTIFFGDPLAFSLAREAILISPNTVNISSIGCSSGEEPYSFVAANLDLSDRVSVNGYDVNPNSIEKARKGKYNYGGEFFRDAGILPGTIYQADTEGLLTLSKSFKQLVTFQTHDISQEPLPEKQDIIFLLNVLQWYAALGREEALSNIRDSLSEKGMLICESRPVKPTGDISPYYWWMEDLTSFGFGTVPAKYGHSYDKPICTQAYYKL